MTMQPPVHVPMTAPQPMPTPVFEEYEPAPDCVCVGCALRRRALAIPLRDGGHPAARGARRALVLAAAVGVVLSGGGAAAPAAATPPPTPSPGSGPGQASGQGSAPGAGQAPGSSAGTGQASGSGAAQGTGQTSGTGAGHASGQDPASGAGQASGPGAGQGTGQASGTGAGHGTGQASGPGAGAGQASGQGASGAGQASGPGTGQASGPGPGTGRGTGEASGSGSGAGTASGSGTGPGAGTGQGAGQASGQGASGAGHASGHGTGQASGAGAGAGAGAGQASGTGSGTASGSGAGTGQASGPGTGQASGSASGQAAGSAAGQASGPTPATGQASGTGTDQGSAAAPGPGAGQASGGGAGAVGQVPGQQGGSGSGPGPSGQGLPGPEAPGSPQGGRAPLHGRPSQAKPPGAPGAPAVVKRIDRTTIINRAKLWVDAEVPYSMSEYWSDGYRQDCSGYVSMAWNLGTNEWTGSLDKFATKITKDELLPGDMLLFHNPANPNNGSHVVLFGGWADETRTAYIAYEQTRPSTRKAPAPYGYWTNGSKYVPYRFNGVTGGLVPEGPATDPKPAVPTAYPGAAKFGPGANNEYVAELGRMLIDRGGRRFYPKGASTLWKDADQLATQAFQTAQGWTGTDADGIPGPHTWQLLTEHKGNDIRPTVDAAPGPAGVPAYPGVSVFRPGSSHPSIAALGRQLAKKGFGKNHTSGPASRWSEADRRNVEAFQRAQGWRGALANGYPGPETWRRLFA